MKVNGEKAGELSGSRQVRPEEVQTTPRSGSGSTRRLSREGEDQVEISSLALQVHGALQAHTAGQARRVEAMTKLYREGQLSVDAAALSGRLVELCLQPGAIVTEGE